MAIVKAILCTSMIVLGAASTVHAADLLPPPPPPVELVSLPSFGNWYLRGDVGVGVNDVSSPRSTFKGLNSFGNPPQPTINRVATELGDVALAGVGVGYQLNNWLRFDGTAEYRTTAAYRSTNVYYGSGYPNYCTATFCQDSYTANIGSAVFLVNGYVDLGTYYGATPFVGAGVGSAVHRFGAITDLPGGGIGTDTTKANLAWALMAGVGFNITPNLKLELSYRYLNMGTLTSSPITCDQTTTCYYEKQSFKLASNDFRIGFRYMFADPLPPAPALYQPPLVRKY